MDRGRDRGIRQGDWTGDETRGLSHLVADLKPAVRGRPHEDEVDPAPVLTNDVPGTRLPGRWVRSIVNKLLQAAELREPEGGNI